MQGLFNSAWKDDLQVYQVTFKMEKHMPYLCLVMLDKMGHENMSTISKCQLRQRCMPHAHCCQPRVSQVQLQIQLRSSALSSFWCCTVSRDFPCDSHDQLCQILHHVFSRSQRAACATFVDLRLCHGKSRCLMFPKSKCHVNSVQNWCVNHHVSSKMISGWSISGVLHRWC